MALYAKYVEGTPNLDKRPSSQGEPHPGVRATDYAKILRVAGQGDVVDLRAKVSTYVWRGWDRPGQRLPDAVERDVFFPPLAGMANLRSVDKYVIKMPYGVDSTAFVLHPVQERPCLMIYQEGHGASFLERRDYLERVVAAGCAAVALSMPLTGGINNQPVIDHPRFGVLTPLNVDALEILNTSSFSAVGFYVTPAMVSLNQILSERKFDRVGMTGFSAGGWITMMVAALDTRIERSYPIAGTAPMTVFAPEPGWGDWLQRLAPLYEIANYPELYVMGSVGAGRSQMQAFNLDDECCFRGRNAEVYAQAIAKRAQELGGRFSVRFYDHDEGHAFTDPAQQDVLADFLGRGGVSG
jgi:hypothetical protein